MNIQNLTGQTLGQYQLRGLLGIGGMGAVYRGLQLSLRREVAVKVLSPQLAQQTGYHDRFIREAETAASLEHQHIIPIYDYGTQQGINYVAMRLLTGGTLADRIRQHMDENHLLPSLAEVAGLLRQLASALDYAHSQGVIHRDIKPSNIMFDNQGNAFIVDFGIAKLIESTTSMTSTGTAMGTPSYMSPEQWRAEPLTPAADQYALGIMTYALLTGHTPFEAPTPYALMHKHLNEAPTPPQVFRPDLPEAVSHVLWRAMAKQPHERFPTCTAFAQAFEAVTQPYHMPQTGFFTLPVIVGLNENWSGSNSALTRMRRPFRSSPITWGVLGIASVLTILLILVLATRGKDDEPSDSATSPIVDQELGAIISTMASETPEIALTQVRPGTTGSPVLAPTASWTPTSSPTIRPTPTQTPDVYATAEALLRERLTQTAESWTDTPTPDLDSTVQALAILAITGTASSWTDTPTSTFTFTPPNTVTPTLTPTVTLTATPTATPPPSNRRSQTVLEP